MFELTTHRQTTMTDFYRHRSLGRGKPLAATAKEVS